MLSVDRADFCPTNTYDDKPQSIGYNTTISAPHMHAITLETLKDHLKKGASALDVGSGSGYITTCMAELVGESGRVIGIDHKKELVELAKRNIEKSHSYLLSSGRIIMVEGDGREGYPDHGPYDAIHVGGATPEIPQMLFDQLAPGGCMLVPVGPAGGDQHLMRVDKDENGIMNVCHIMGVIFGALSSN
ncbi:unnamed protein product [Anisakis simplex]|uniref:Protein-L-isoaspartate O-methyltransferase n=1 Tax=Anisakis simplex TaxID=6269 RepID=A0A0M3J266_ANISI|nr:unnamed protein product [Anisakis simplex]